MNKNISLPTSRLFLTISILFIISGCAAHKNLPRKTIDKINLISRTISPTPGIEKKLARTLLTTRRPKVHAIVQFQKQLTLEEHKFLHESGIQFANHLGGSAYAVSIPMKTDLNTGKLKELIKWAGQVDTKDKLKTDLARDKIYDWAINKKSGKIKLMVQFYRDVEKGTVKNDLSSIGIDGKKYGADNSWAVIVDKSKIKEIANLDSVKMIQQGPIPFLPLNDGGRRVVNTDEAQQQTYNNPQPAYNKVSGVGIQIGICDSGVDEGHDDLDQITAAGTAGASRVYNQRPGSDVFHGTHVASVAAGNGFNSENNGLPAFSLRGHAPRADVGDYPHFSGNAQLYYDAIVNDGTDVTNHSYVQSFFGYDAVAESLDSIIRGDAFDTNGNPIPPRPQVWAAGNSGVESLDNEWEGYYAVYTSSKNSISVGGVDTIDTRIYMRSSLGPTFDGRIKPDIVAPACADRMAVPMVGIQAADNNTQGYAGGCGTSMAAPAVSGIIALMMEQFQNAFGNQPNLPATYKAMLIHTARDMVKTEAYDTREFDNPDTNAPVLYHAGPDFATGYGLVDAESARDIVTRSDQWRESSINATGSTRTWCIRVPEGSDEFKVTIAWDDEPGSTVTAEDVAKLVNDLDLEIIDPNGNKYLPWTLDPLPISNNPVGGALDPIQPDDVNPAYRGEDHRNNVEMFNIHLPMQGIWKAVVKGHDLPNGNAQSYSLVSSHKILDFCPLPPEPFCRIVPWLCPPVVDICVRYPWICTLIPERWEFPPPVDYTFDINPRIPFPVAEICKYVLDCPGCEGAGWSYCAGWQMDVFQVPVDAAVTVINQVGEIMVENTKRSATRSLVLKKVRPGDDHFIVITRPDGKPYSDMLKLQFKMKSHAMK